MCKQEHRHAVILRAIADGEQIQITSPHVTGQWSDIGPNCVLENMSSLRKDVLYRIKPQTILINGMEVPEPIKVKPKKGDVVFVVHLADAIQATKWTWADDAIDNRAFKRGLCHSTRQAAFIHCQALLSFTQNELS